jgi:beta-xylosidase
VRTPAAILRRLALVAVLGWAGTGARLAAAAPWIPDQGDGTYRNPVLFADYSDPDAVRVGDDFYLVSSSFHCTPGLPVLHSKDLVNWEIIAHALPAQVPADHFSTPHHGEGVWAPAIRFHGGKFWIYYPDPDFGIYVVTATDPAGAWSAPVLVAGGKGLIDPCPLWDDDGQLYLIHGWAKSRAGINNRLTVNRLSPDGLRLADSGTVVIDADKMPGWNTLEGPKLYKRHGYYYIFAPAGGVGGGYQAVFRAKNIYGPYESRIVLDQGHTAINGPHQGAWVDTPTGEDWFLHFQDRGPFGRVVHLEPMAWRKDDWPVIGSDPAGTGRGEPVLAYRKPDVGRTYPVAVPQTSDEFNRSALGLQWQWNANPRPEWASLTARPGFLRLACWPESEPFNLYNAPNLLLQKFPAPAFTVTTRLELVPGTPGGPGWAGYDETAGLIVFGYDYAWVGLEAFPGQIRLVERTAHTVAGRDVSASISGPLTGPKGPITGPVYFRVAIDREAVAHFSYSLDGAHYIAFTEPLQAKVDRWIGAKVGVFAAGPPGGDPAKAGHADFDWFRVTP